MNAEICKPAAKKRVVSLVIVPDSPGYIRATITYSDGSSESNPDCWTRAMAWKWATQRMDQATRGEA